MLSNALLLLLASFMPLSAAGATTPKKKNGRNYTANDDKQQSSRKGGSQKSPRAGNTVQHKHKPTSKVATKKEALPAQLLVNARDPCLFKQVRTAGGETLNDTKIKMRAIDYFDTLSDISTTKVNVVLFDKHQLWGEDHAGGAIANGFHTLAEPTSCTVEVLPKSAASDVSTNSILVSTGVAVRPNGILGEISIASTTSKVIHPTNNTKWVQVAHINYRDLFQGATMPVAPVDSGACELFRIACMDPDSGAAHAAKLQVRYTVRYEVTLPPLAYIEGQVTETTNWTAVPAYTHAYLPAQVEALKIV